MFTLQRYLNGIKVTVFMKVNWFLCPPELLLGVLRHAVICLELPKQITAFVNLSCQIIILRACPIQVM